MGTGRRGRQLGEGRRGEDVWGHVGEGLGVEVEYRYVTVTVYRGTEINFYFSPLLLNHLPPASECIVYIQFVSSNLQSITPLSLCLCLMV